MVSQLVYLEQRAWSREDVRFVRDFNPSPTVSYPAMVALLPKDKIQDTNGEAERTNEEMEAERRKIEAENRVMRRVFRVEEEKIPFPTLIKVEQTQNTKGQKVVHDLKEAVQLVKELKRREEALAKGLMLCLVWNLITVTAAWFQGEGPSIWLFDVICVIRGVPGAYLLWYRPLYRAMKYNSKPISTVDDDDLRRQLSECDEEIHLLKEGQNEAKNRKSPNKKR